MLKKSAEDSLMVIEKMKQINVTPDAITTTVQFHWASALVGILPSQVPIKQNMQCIFFQIFDTFAPVPLIGLSPPGNSMHMSKYKNPNKAFL